ncbi:UNVERIFIED_CONTAM: hypothetical protein GTU68_011038, partial [Idotea baltica]|nr:hypothetical protein [Idotea baltica]
KPVVLTDTELCESALKWDLSYLQENLGEAKYTVFASSDHIFKYFDVQKIEKFTPNYVPATEKLEIKFSEFVDKLLEWKPGENRLYLQQPLNNTVGPAIVKDFLSFNWAWLDTLQRKNKWGPLTSNLLLIGMEGNVTPAHYDEQQNFFSQLIGVKRCILFPPEHYENLYPHTVYHPHDRQSQVDLENPDFERFPGLRHLKGFEAILSPGDVLYIPIYWWHHISPLEDQVKCSVSVNFWYKVTLSKRTIEYPLIPQHKLAIVRNIEKMLLEALKDPKEVGPLLRAIVNGRYSCGAEDQDIF